MIVISETVCLVKYYAYAFLSSTNPHEFGQSLKAPAKSSQSPRPSNTEGIHPHIFLQAPRREQGDCLRCAVAPPVEGPQAGAVTEKMTV